jgi:hypothetical protein
MTDTTIEQPQVSAPPATAPAAHDLSTEEGIQDAFRAWREGKGPDPLAPQPEAKDAPKPEAAADADSDDEEDEAEVASEDGQQKPPKKISGFKKKLLQEKAAKAALEAQLRELKAKYEPEPKGQPKEPEIEQYGSVEEYLEAVRNWGLEVGKYEAAQEAIRKKEREKELATAERINKQFADIAGQDAAFLANVQQIPEGWWTAPAVREYLSESDHVGRLAQWLAANPDRFEAIAGSSPIAATRELARIEAQLTLATGDAPKPEKAAPVSDTKKPAVAPPRVPPAPIQPLPPSSAPLGPAYESKPVDEWTMDEYRDWRRRQTNGR